MKGLEKSGNYRNKHLVKGVCLLTHNSTNARKSKWVWRGWSIEMYRSAMVNPNKKKTRTLKISILETYVLIE